VNRPTLRVVFATVLLLGQLVFGVAARAMPCESGAAHCPGCPPASAAMHGGQGSVAHCHVPHGPVHHAPAGCMHGCTMHAGACGSTGAAALTALVAMHPVSLQQMAWAVTSSPRLPDSPQFDFLRPPNRA